MANLRWNGPQFQRAVTAHMRRNLSAACIALVNHAKELISIEGTGRAIAAHVGRYGWGPAKKYRKKQLIYNFSPSSPGEPPHVQTGRLRGSVAWEVVGLLGRVGTNVKYGRWLELGTKRLAARPWLRPSLDAMRSALIRILTRPMP